MQRQLSNATVVRGVCKSMTILLLLTTMLAVTNLARGDGVLKVITKDTQDRAEIGFQLTLTRRGDYTVFELLLPPDREATKQVFAAHLVIGEQERIVVAAPLDLAEHKGEPQGTRIIRNVTVADNLLDCATLQLRRRTSGPQSDREYLYDVRLSTFVGFEAQQSSAVEPRDAAATPMVKGLEMSIGLDQGAYRADEPARLEVFIKNTAEEEVSLGMSASDLSSFDLVVQYTGGGMAQGGRAPLTRYGAQVLSDFAAAKNVPIRLKSGEQSRYQFPLNRMYDMSVSGTYSVTARRYVPGQARYDGAGQPMTLDPKAKPPEELISNELSVEITEPKAGVVRSLVAAQAAGDDKPDRGMQRQEQIERQQAAWQKGHGKLGVYTYVIQYSCECAQSESGAVLVEVEKGRAIAARSVHTGKELPERRRDLFLRTIDDIFEELQAAAKKDIHKLDVIYHPSGYPLNISVDSSAAAKDDEYEIEILIVNPGIVAREAQGESSPEAVEALRNKIAALEGLFLWTPPLDAEEQERLAQDSRRLRAIREKLKEYPDDDELRQQAVALAKRIAKTTYRNWEDLVTLGVLKDGLALVDAMLLVGSPTERSQEHVGWYSNPHRFHVAPYLTARVTADGLRDWKITRR